MDELYSLVAKKTGLDKKTAKQAVDIVIDFIKKKLPASVASQIDAVISGEGALGAMAGALDDGKLDLSDAASLLGGFLGGEPEKKKKKK